MFDRVIICYFSNEAESKCVIGFCTKLLGVKFGTVTLSQVNLTNIVKRQDTMEWIQGMSLTIGRNLNCICEAWMLAAAENSLKLLITVP